MRSTASSERSLRNDPQPCIAPGPRAAVASGGHAPRHALRPRPARRRGVLVGAGGRAATLRRPSAPGPCARRGRRTIRVRLGGRSERVRYIGVDTPSPSSPARPCSATPSARRPRTARWWPAPGAPGRRRRGARPLRAPAGLLYREPDGAFVNAALVRDGYARTLTIAPNVAHAREFAQLAGTARRERARPVDGLLDRVASVPPWPHQLQQSLAALSAHSWRRPRPTGCAVSGSSVRPSSAWTRAAAIGAQARLDALRAARARPARHGGAVTVAMLKTL